MTNGSSPQRPLCFVLMPFGQKPAVAGGIIDFDAVYRELIAPAIEAAGLEPIRADEEMTGGVIHTPMFERLILCEYAVADLTTANANVFYELGVRHAVRSWSTVLLFAEGGGQLPFDVAPLRALPYRLGPDGKPSEVETAKKPLVARLIEAQNAANDSPVFALVDDFPNTKEIAHTKTDTFREQVRYAVSMKERLAVARKEGVAAVRAIEEELAGVGTTESGVVIDLFLSYRAVKAWPEMIALVGKMTPPLAETVMVQEQYALALNRDGQGDKAERVLLDLIDKRGPSSETYGILGRIYKDRWEAEATKEDGSSFLAEGILEQAIAAYLKGFEVDWRDGYPGINAVTLMALKEPPDPRREELIPVVRYAVERRIAAGEPDYWDHATLLELAVLGKDRAGAVRSLRAALAMVREVWEPETTLRNLRLIREARERGGDPLPWASEVENALKQSAGG